MGSTAISPTGFSISFENAHRGSASEAVVDAWELKAARRALMNLRILLHGKPMWDLIKAQVDAQDALLKGYAASSDGKWNVSITKGKVAGMTSAQFFGWMMANFKASAPGVGTAEERQKSVFKIGYPMHPEHYLPTTEVFGYLGIVETMGGLPTRTRVAAMPPDQAPDFIKAYFKDDFPHKLTGGGQLDDGTPVTYVLHQFRDTPDGSGFEMELHNFWPAACPQIFVDEHEEHFSVEFRNGVRMAAEEILGA